MLPSFQPRALVAIVGPDDPFALDAVSGEPEWDGPALVATGAFAPARVLLIASPAHRSSAFATGVQLRARHPEAEVEVVEIGAVGVAELAGVLGGRIEGPSAWAVPAGDGEARALASAVAARLVPAVRVVGVRVRRSIADAEPGVVPPGGPPGMTEIVSREPSAAYRVEADGRAPAWDRGVAARGTGIASLTADIRGDDPAFRAALARAMAVAPHREPVLLGGETGTGKGLLARAIHLNSGRPEHAFVAVNCSGLPETLAESLLFGHRKGAFTGAAADQAGVFERADGGTLFLDEIGELPPAVQPKLLKVLDDGLVEPLGATKPRAVNVRVIAATHRNLRDLVREKTFREDLFYRLSVIEIRLPALRERRADIGPLALHILRDLTRGARAPRHITPAAIRRLEHHAWPGNIRELRNVLSRSLLFSTGPTLDVADLLFDEPATAGDPLDTLPTPHEGFSIDAFLSDARRRILQRALAMTGGNQSAASRLVGLTPQALHKFVRGERPSDTNPG